MFSVLEESSVHCGACSHRRRLLSSFECDVVIFMFNFSPLVGGKKNKFSLMCAAASAEDTRAPSSPRSCRALLDTVLERAKEENAYLLNALERTRRDNEELQQLAARQRSSCGGAAEAGKRKSRPMTWTERMRHNYCMMYGWSAVEKSTGASTAPRSVSPSASEEQRPAAESASPPPEPLPVLMDAEREAMDFAEGRKAAPSSEPCTPTAEERALEEAREAAAAAAREREAAARSLLVLFDNETCLGVAKEMQAAALGAGAQCVALKKVPSVRPSDSPRGLDNKATSSSGEVQQEMTKIPAVTMNELPWFMSIAVVLASTPGGVTEEMEQLWRSDKNDSALDGKLVVVRCCSSAASPQSTQDTAAAGRESREPNGDQNPHAVASAFGGARVVLQQCRVAYDGRKYGVREGAGQSLGKALLEQKE